MLTIYNAGKGSAIWHYDEKDRKKLKFTIENYGIRCYSIGKRKRFL